jgi:hypothetical protein
MVRFPWFSRQDIAYAYDVTHSLYHVAIRHVYADANDDPFTLTICRCLSPENKCTLALQEPGKPCQLHIADLSNLNGKSYGPLTP